MNLSAKRHGAFRAVETGLDPMGSDFAWVGAIEEALKDKRQVFSPLTLT